MEAGRVNKLLVLAVILGCILGTLNAIASFKDVRNYGGTDLRGRVTGSRLMLRGMDAYRTPVDIQNADPLLRDPDRSVVGVTRCTYAPTVLLVYGFLSGLPWTTERLAWACIEWISLLTSAWLIYRTSLRNVSRRAKLAALAVFAGLFAGGYFWQYHVERGQYYAQILLMLTSGAALCLWGASKGGTSVDRWWYGIPFGMAASWRPPMILIALPLWLLGLRRSALGTVAACIACVLASLPFAGTSEWASFNYAVNYRQNLVLHPALEEAERQRVPYIDPHVEGVTFGANMLPSKDMNSSLIGVMQLLHDRAHVPIPFVDEWPLLAKGLMALLCVGAIFAFPRLSTRSTTIAEHLALCITFVLVVDQIVTPIRAGYVDILYVLPFGLLAPSVSRNHRLATPTIIALFGIAISNLMNFGLDGHGVIANFIRDVCILGALIWAFVILFSQVEGPREAHAGLEPSNSTV
jgi:hypothetical protein